MNDFKPGNEMLMINWWYNFCFVLSWHWDFDKQQG